MNPGSGKKDVYKRQDQAVLLEHLADAQRHRANLVKRNVRHRVEIHAQLVGAVEVAAAHRPRVPVDHPQVHAPRQMGGVGNHQLARRAAAREMHGRRGQPLRRAVRRCV